MNKIIRKVQLFLIMLIAVLILNPIYTYAATAKTSVSAEGGEIGDTIAVNIQISSDYILGVYEIYIDYDENKLICPDNNDVQGGGGRVKIIGGADMSESSSASYTINFEAKAAGTTKIEVSGSAYYFDEATGDVVDMVVEPSVTKVKIKSPVQASSDNTLSALSLQTDSATGISKAVKLDPEFSPEVTEYHTTFTYDVNKVVVSATQADPKATVEISGTRIDLGDNTTTITVTAEDGSVKEYIIYSTKTTDLPAPTTDPEEDTTEETTTKPEKADDNIYVESMEKYIIIDVARGISKNLVLMYLADDEELTNGAFYIYDTENNSFYKMCNIQTDKKLYTIIKTPDNLKIPEGFLEKKVKINGVNVDAWAIDGDDTFYLVYAMNWEGSTGLYVFDRSEGTMQRYISNVVNASKDENEEAEEDETVIADNKELESVYATMNELKKDYKEDRDLKWKIIVGIAIVCVILIILCIVLLSKLKDVEIIEEEEEVTPNEPQLKLDMAQHANEMNIGVLAANVEEIVNEEAAEQLEPEIIEESEETNVEEANVEAIESVEAREEVSKEATEQPKQTEVTQQEMAEELSSEKMFITPTEPKFVQPAEMKIVTPEVFEQVSGLNETDDFSDIEGEITVGGFDFVEAKQSGDNNADINATATTAENVIDIQDNDDDDDEFEIEFVEIDNED